MKKLWTLFFFISFLFGGELKIATFNVENLFDGQNNGNEYHDFKIGSSDWNNEKYIKKLDNISKVIEDVDADIIALQEVENDEVMKNLAKKNGYEYYKFSKTEKSPTGLGVLSKIKIENYKIYRESRVKTRDILRVDFNFEDEEFSLFVCHFPSAKNSMRERKIIANLLKNVLKDSKNAIALGDFNTDFGSKSLLNDIIRLDHFTDLWKFLPANKRSSHVSFRAIDHIILAPKFFTSSTLSYKKNSFEVYQPNVVSNIFGTQTSYSDHYPIYFKLTTKEPYNQILPSMTIGEIYLNKTTTKDVKLEKVAVIYKDKNGFVVSQNGRGIYVFERDHDDILLGSLVDMVVHSVHEYKDNIEISSFDILKTYDKMVDIKEYMLPQEKLQDAKSGDVLRSIRGDIENGILKSKFGDIKIYKSNHKLKNGKDQIFVDVLVRNFDGKKELVLRDFN